MFTGVLFTIVSFCLARHFLSRNELALLAAFFVSVAPRFVDTSYWNGSARAPFVAMAAFCVLLAFRAGYSNRTLLYGLLAFSIIVCFSLHHMAVLFVLFGLAYLLSVVVTRMTAGEALGMRVGNHRKWAIASFLFTLIVVISLLSVYYLSYFVFSLSYDYEKTSLFSIAPANLSIVLNVAASYTNQVGFILPVAILGIPVLLRRNRVSTESVFLLMLPIVFIPLLPSSLYVAMLLVPYFAILGTSWIGLWFRDRKKIAVYFVVPLLICSSVLLPVWSSNRWNSVEGGSGDAVRVDDQFFNDGAYLIQYRNDARAICNVDLVSLRLSAISGTLFMGSELVEAISGELTADMVKGNLTWADQDFPKNLYQFLELENNGRDDFVIISLFTMGVQYANGSRDMVQYGYEYFKVHSRLLVVIDEKMPSSYVWVWGTYPARLPSELRNAQWGGAGYESPPHSLSSYMIYQSQRISLFALEVPP